MTILQKTKGVCHAVIRFFTVLFFWQIPQFAYLYCKFYLYDFELYPDVARQVGVICTAVAMLAFHSGVRYATACDTPLREKFYALEKRPQTLPERLRFFLIQPGLWTRTAVFALLFSVLHPNGYAMYLFDLFPNVAQNYATRIWFPALLLLLLFLLSLKAQLTAMKRWLVIENQQDSDHTGKQKKKKKTAEEAAYMIAIYMLGTLGLCYIAPQLIPLLPLLRDILFAPLSIFVIVCIVVLPVIWRLMRAILKRRSFLKQLRQTCREKEIPLSAIDLPYRSIFRITDCESFSVTINGKRYACKLISAIRANAPMVLRTKGRGCFRRPFRLARVTLFTRVTNFEYGFASEDQKILIINPVPKKIYWYENGKQSLLDNGDTVDGYKVYTATGFLGALDRDCIDR